MSDQCGMPLALYHYFLGLFTHSLSYPPHTARVSPTRAANDVRACRRNSVNAAADVRRGLVTLQGATGEGTSQPLDLKSTEWANDVAARSSTRPGRRCFESTERARIDFALTAGGEARGATCIRNSSRVARGARVSWSAGYRDVDPHRFPFATASSQNRRRMGNACSRYLGAPVSVAATRAGDGGRTRVVDRRRRLRFQGHSTATRGSITRVALPLHARADRRARPRAVLRRASQSGPGAFALSGALAAMSDDGGRFQPMRSSLSVRGAAAGAGASLTLSLVVVDGFLRRSATRTITRGQYNFRLTGPADSAFSMGTYRTTSKRAVPFGFSTTGRARAWRRTRRGRGEA
jgi:hypothetical protein